PDVVVESEYTLEADNSGSSSWIFPVDGSRAISATLDSEDVPVSILPEGQFASVRVAGRLKRSKLVIRRSVVSRAVSGGESIALAINPVVSARLVIERHPEGLPGDAPGARGVVSIRDFQSTGLLGPVDRLEIRWASPPSLKSEAVRPRVDSLYLWD